MDLKILLRSCGNKVEAEKLLSAYLRESKGKETLMDKVLLARKRKETGVKKPERKPPASREPAISRNDTQQVKQTSDPRPIKPLQPDKQTPHSSSPASPEPVKEKPPPPKPSKPVTPPSQKKSGKVEEYDDVSTDEESSKRKKETNVKKYESKKDVAQSSSKPTSQKHLYDYYNKKETIPDKQPKPETANKVPNHAAYYAKLTKPQSTTKAKKKKSNKKKLHNGFDDFSSSESEEEEAQVPKSKPATSVNKPKEETDEESGESSEDEKTAVKEEVSRKEDLEEESDESDDGAKTTNKKEDNKKEETDDESDESEVDTKTASKKEASQTEKTESVKASAKVASENVTAVAAVTAANSGSGVTTEDNINSETKKDKTVTWNSNVTSPKPTTRKSKKDKKKSKRKSALESVKEEDDTNTKVDAKSAKVEEEKEPQPLAAAVPQSKEEDGEKHVAVPPSPSIKDEGTSDTSSQVSHVNEKPALAGPFYPSTLSLDSRKSQREAEAQLQPSQSVSENELKEQLHAIDEPKDLPVVVPTPIAPPVMEKTEAEERKSRQDQLDASEKRNLSPYKVLPEIPSKSKSKESESKPSWPSLAKLKAEAKKEKTGDSLIVYAKPHKSSKKSKSERKDFGPYIDVLDKVCDTDLQYIIARTGVTLGIEKPVSVAKARMAQILNQKKTAKLDQKILKRLQKQNGAYKKRIDKFLSK